MSSSAEKIIPIQPETMPGIRQGSVIAVEPGNPDMVVAFGGNSMRARRAFSCIVDPEPGDIVICTENESGLLFILGIIERPSKQKTRLSFPDDTDIQVNRGSLNIYSPDRVSVAANEVNCFSRRVIHKSDEAVISYNNVTARGDDLQASFKTVRIISNLINTMAKQVIDRFKGYIRSTEDHDMVKAGHITRTAEGLHSMDAEHTIINSKECTKVDGAKILMG